MEDHKEEKIDIKKAAVGIVKPLNYIKAGVFTVNIGILLAIAIGAYTVFGWIFPKKPTNSQTTGITVARGAKVDSIVIENKQEESKQTVGLEFSASSKDAGIMFKKYINSKWHVGIGARWEYDNKNSDIPVKPEIRVGVDF